MNLNELEIAAQNLDTDGPVHDGLSMAELDAAFDLVKDPMDWRAEISAEIWQEAAEAVGGESAIKSAVEFFTATTPRFCTFSGRIIVSADGYRMGPAGP